MRDDMSNMQRMKTKLIHTYQDEKESAIGVVEAEQDVSLERNFW